MLRSAILMILLCRGLWASAETVYTVDCNGGGDFRTIQACFDALPSKPAEWRTVRIMPGTYREKVTLDVYKDKVVVVGCGKYPGDVRLVWDDHSGKVVDGRELTTYDSYTFSVQADDVLLHNLEICNDAGRVGQAVALETRGDRIWIDGCRQLHHGGFDHRAQQIRICLYPLSRDGGRRGDAGLPRASVEIHGPDGVADVRTARGDLPRRVARLARRGPQGRRVLRRIRLLRSGRRPFGTCGLVAGAYRRGGRR